MGNSQPKTNTNVVIVGGGLGGAQLAHLLDKYCKVTLIEPRDSLVYKIAGPRAALSGDTASKAVMPLNNLFPHGGRHIRKWAKGVDANQKHVTVEEKFTRNFRVGHDGTTIPYDYLVIATGAKNSSWVEPLGTSGPEIVKNYQRCAFAVKNAEKIMIVGGGATGCEIAGEIKKLKKNENYFFVC